MGQGSSEGELIFMAATRRGGNDIVVPLDANILDHCACDRKAKRLQAKGLEVL